MEKYQIVKTENGQSEVIDYANDISEAKFYSQEYQKEFGIKTSVKFELNPEYTQE